MLPPLSETVTLTCGGEPLTLPIRPLPIGFHRRLLVRGLTPPPVPQTVARDARGLPLRDTRGLAVMIEQPSDPAYQAAKAEADERIAAVTLSEAIDDAVTRPQPPPADDAGPQAWQDHADAVLASMTAAGLSAGDFATLCRAVAQASGLLGPSLDAEADRLFPAAAAKTDSPRCTARGRSTSTPCGSANASD